MTPESLLRRILCDMEYVSIDHGRLTVDGSFSLTADEEAWIEELWKEMQPIWDERERVFWEKAIAERVELAKAGSTADRERLTYFANREIGIPKELAREALIANGWDRDIG